ncbi:MAG: hypothetical protein HOV83_20725 [Catenulispora sp.]|nr:hypothetical protein [Catenulispora sp.]
MGRADFFLDPNGGFYRFAPTSGNGVTVFYDNARFFDAIRSDLATARHESQFVYFAGWWSDLRLPMGDPKASPKPPTLGALFTELSEGLPVPSPDQTPANPDERQFGPEIRCMLWQHKAQVDLSAVPGIALPDSLFGAPILAAINTATVKAINALRGNNAAILDKRHALFGSHHQKFTVMLTDGGLVAYVGSSDYNADRLYPEGDRDSPSAPGKGAPLNDVNLRLTGPAAQDVLKIFVDRWRAHPDGRNRPLKGETYKTLTSSASQGGAVEVQMSNTYAKGYPFTDAVRSAADTQVKICRTAVHYVYFEDQYMIGTPELWNALRDKLSSNVEFTVIAVMAPLAVVGDLPWLKERRSDFWLPLFAAYPGRVLLFEMLAPDGTDTGPGAYLHNKMTIADDAIVTVGSVNFSRRSHTHDSEIMATFGGPAGGDANLDIALRIRADRWARHLGTKTGDPPPLPDALAAFRRLTSTARIRTWAPMPNTLTPAVRAVYRRAYDIVFDPA